MNIGALSANDEASISKHATLEGANILWSGTNALGSLGQVLSIADGNASNAPINGNFDTGKTYWTSTQSDNNEAYEFSIGNSNIADQKTGFTPRLKIHQSNVRAFIAF